MFLQYLFTSESQIASNGLADSNIQISLLWNQKSFPKTVTR